MEGVDTEFLRDFRGLLFLRTEDGSLFAPLGLRFRKTDGFTLSGSRDPRRGRLGRDAARWHRRCGPDRESVGIADIH